MSKVFTFNSLSRILFIGLALLLAGSAPLFADDDYFETEGAIQVLDADSLVVNGFVFDVDNQTRVMDDSLGMIAYSDLRQGDRVKVEAREMQSGRYLAREIKRKNGDNDHDGDHDDDHDGREMETRGFISALGDSSLTVNGYTFWVTANTRFKAEHDRMIGFDDLVMDMNVKVEGYWQGDTLLIAKKVEVKDGEDRHDDEMEFKGVIDSVLSDAIAINNYIIQVNDQTSIRLAHDQFGSFQDLQAGMYVEVEVLSTDSALVALRIHVENDQEKEIEITGAIDSLGTDFIYVLGYRVEVNAYTKIENYNADSLGMGGLEKGLRVKVKGNLTADNTISARKIKVKRFYDRKVEFSGEITAIGNGNIQVGQTLFLTDSNTVVYDDNHNRISPEQLTVGLFVEVKAQYDDNGDLWALKIKVESPDRDRLEYTGEIIAISADSINVNNRLFYVDSNTVILGFQGETLAFENLVVGDVVEIKAEMQADGSFYALRIKLEDSSDMIMVAGPITAISDSSIWVNGPEFRFNANTTVLDRDYQPIDLSQYSVGQDVTILAVDDGSGSPQVVQSQLGVNATITGLPAESGTVVTPKAFVLNANYPNPFNPETTISFQANFQGFRQVTLEVYDITGRKMQTLYSGPLDAGRYRFKWNGRNALGQAAASGMYIYRLSSENTVISRKMMLLR